MRIFKAFIKRIINLFYITIARKKLSLLRNINEPEAEKIANAIYNTLDNNLEPQEKVLIKLIEAKRKVMENSTDKISITDYGAGDPSQTRDENEMYQGYIEEITVGEMCRIASKPYFWSLLLFNLVKEFKPLKIIELGTCLGISGAYQALAQKLNKSGMLISLEGSKSLAEIAGRNFKELGIDNVQIAVGRFQDNLDNILTEQQYIDYFFIDGHHDEKATVDYFNKILPFLSKTSVLVFDDISWSDGMRRAWNTIEKNKIVKISINLNVIGICVLSDKIADKYSFNLVLK